MLPQATKRRNCFDDILDLYEERMEGLYLRENLPLHRVKEMIDAESGQNIPMARYRDEVRENGWEKHMTHGAAKPLAIILKKRFQENKTSEVLQWGKPLSQEKVARIIARSRPTTLEMMGSPQLPRGFSIRTPSPEPPQKAPSSRGISYMITNTEDLLSNIPWLQFEEALDVISRDPQGRSRLADTSVNPESLQNLEDTLGPSSLNIAENWNSAPLYSGCIDSLEPSFFANNLYVLAKMESLLPSSLIRHHLVGSSLTGYDAKIANAFTRQQLLFSKANNFAGLNEFPIWQPFKLLGLFNTDVLHLLSRLPKGPAARSFIQGLFKAAIEVNAYTVVNGVLSMSDDNRWPGVDVNKEKILISTNIYTPIQRASMLRHGETMKILLKYGADVNKTYRNSSLIVEVRTAKCTKSLISSGALECAILSVPYKKLDIELFKLLCDRTNSDHYYTLQGLIKYRKEDQICHLIQNYASEVQWDQQLLEELFQVLSEEIMLSLMASLVETRAQPFLLNVAAARGYKRLFERLRSEYNLRPNYDTLCSAVEGGDTQLVQALLLEGASARSNWDNSCLFSDYGPPPDQPSWKRRKLHRTPLSVAIAKQNKELIDLLKKEDVFTSLDSLELCEPAWNAAAEADDLEMLKELFLIRSRAADRGSFELDSTSIFYSKLDEPPRLDLSLALNVASKTGDYQFAESLVAAGANTTNSLMEAIDNKQGKLFELFLDSGASAHPRRDRTTLYPLEAAVEWGNYSVVPRLLAEDAEFTSRVLYDVVRKEDEEFIEMFVNAGLDVNCALRIAARLGNVDIGSYMLEKGADPCPEALELAFQTNRELFETILTAHNKRYSYRRKTFGSEVLCLAIERNDTALIKHLLDHNADPHGLCRKNNTPITPFGYAIATDKSRNFATVQQFLRVGCLPSDIVFHGDPLTNPAFESRIIDRSDDSIFGPQYINSSNPRITAFIAAIGTRNVELVRVLAKIDSSIIHAVAVGAIKRTALQRAAEIGDFTMVKFLYDLGADVNEPPNRIGGATALQLAAIGGFLKIVCYLIDKGANINAQGAQFHGMTALVGAASQGRIDTVSTLVQACKKANVIDERQMKKAMEVAEQYGHYPTYDYLLQEWQLSQPEVLSLPTDVEEYINYSLIAE
ncbi:ankyrin [Xylaria venustula]|nr:ankyrin [Xylaria venustula]